jgi:hypothetical protein
MLVVAQGGMVANDVLTNDEMEMTAFPWRGPETQGCDRSHLVASRSDRPPSAMMRRVWGGKTPSVCGGRQNPLRDRQGVARLTHECGRADVEITTFEGAEQIRTGYWRPTARPFSLPSHLASAVGSKVSGDAGSSQLDEDICLRPTGAITRLVLV